MHCLPRSIEVDPDGPEGDFSKVLHACSERKDGGAVSCVCRSGDSEIEKEREERKNQ